jgi:hypothetical protein
MLAVTFPLFFVNLYTQPDKRKYFNNQQNMD